MLSSTERALARLAVELSETQSFGQTADQIVAFAMDTVGTEFAGITMLRAHHFETVGPSAPSVVEADQLQYQFNEGPCVDAALESRVLMSDDLGADARWPRWGAAAVDLGFRSVLSAELHAGGGRIGALNLYGSQIRQFTEGDAETATLFAQHAAAALAAVTLQDELRNAMNSRTLIGQAQGILMERFELGPDQAFAVLRRYSQDNNVKLTEVARHLVETSTLPGDTPRELPRSS